MRKYAPLAYVEDAKDTTHAAFKPGSNCLNCQFFIAANGACTLIPGFAVAPAGWCAVWAKKAQATPAASAFAVAAFATPALPE